MYDMKKCFKQNLYDIKEDILYPCLFDHAIMLKRMKLKRMTYYITFFKVNPMKVILQFSSRYLHFFYYIYLALRYFPNVTNSCFPPYAIKIRTFKFDKAIQETKKESD